MVAMPKKAMIHIQKMAPGPPIRMAPQAPTMLPVPTWAATAVASAWKELSPLSCLPPFRLKLPKKRRQPSLKQRSCTKRVRMEKKSPVPTRRRIRT